jgi:hypothetical protein
MHLCVAFLSDPKASCVTIMTASIALLRNLVVCDVCMSEVSSTRLRTVPSIATHMSFATSTSTESRSTIRDKSTKGIVARKSEVSCSKPKAIDLNVGLGVGSPEGERGPGDGESRRPEYCLVCVIFVGVRGLDLGGVATELLSIKPSVEILQSVKDREEVEGSPSGSSPSTTLSMLSLLTSKLRNRGCSSELCFPLPENLRIKPVSELVVDRIDCELRDLWDMPSLTLESIRLLTDLCLCIRP